jgi:hypothetical protein
MTKAPETYTFYLTTKGLEWMKDVADHEWRRTNGNSHRPTLWLPPVEAFAKAAAMVVRPVAPKIKHGWKPRRPVA